MKIKKKYFIIAIFIILGLVIAISVFTKEKESYEGQTTTVGLGTIQKTIEETGSVYSKRINTFYSDMSQKVEVLNVKVGDKVKKGDVILTYESNFELEIERANKQVEAITAEYNESAKGADFQEVSNIKLNINTIENNLDFARSNFDKIKTLYENNVVSQVDYEEAENNVLLLENQLQEAKNNYDQILQGVSSNVKRQYEAQIEEIMVQIKILEKNLEQTSIIAEFDGVVTELNVHQGSMTQTGVPVVEIQDESNLGIYVEILAEDAHEITDEMPFIIMNGDEIDEELIVNRIYPKAQSKVSDLGVEQKRIRIEADLKENNNLKIGTDVDIVIVIEEKNNVLLIDRDAVYEKSHKEYVTLINGTEEIETEIITGLKGDKNVEVISGLKENDIVLIEY
ncbi:efflux RND transporter periplasmic adaptor subunit [Sedimentibacter sp. MB31-C6]|uniref:efflux RND transporter periplasmic adaptor subunit n=1 Tax=Sedimentibacter sp. MB31-C6 TaxID=3109366 RepID=UPI002DDCBC2F|nr:HlyD family efflux transporter periplasmic adaptor subunit [Sedimentibacter sp. MB36-C1]WSI05072.1 HlyD family efflux transporter periplasmic adaptor subunit [Sedimentibacter sp. MB36-C1]